MSRIEAHPDAAIFPMMSAEELADMAADIKENGQRFPIVIGKHENREVIVDGRNRYEACEIAGVEPKFEKLNGHDPKAFILSVNISRRHMTAAQRVMAVAMIYPKPASSRYDTTTSGLADDGSLSKARTVLRHSRSLAEAVLSGVKPLIDAYDEARRAEGKLSNESIRLRQLRDTRPDLAERVVQGETTLDDAVALAKSEAEARKQQRWAATVNLIDGIKLLDRDADTAAAIAADFDPSIVEQRGETFTPSRLRRAAAFLTNLADIMEKQA